MRVLISKKEKLKLLKSLKNKYCVKNIGELSKKVKIKQKTLEGWFYIEKRCLPYKFILQFPHTLEIEKRQDNWGQVLGGKIGYKNLIRKHGKEQVKSFNALGGKKGAITKEKNTKPLIIDIKNNSFLELYGALLGDGWLNSLKKESRWGIGLCGHLKLDKSYLEYLAKIVNNLLQRKGYFSRRPKNNVLEFRFRHKQFFKFLTQDLNFPMGKKENLKIHHQILSLGYDKVRYVIRGLFDTDGSFYLDKNKKGIRIYPILSIHMWEPILMEQLSVLLRRAGFKISFEKTNNQIKLKGSKQLKKWMLEIGSSNPYKKNKMEKALMAQLDSATDS